MFIRKIAVMPSDVSSLGIIKLRNLLDYFQDTAALAVEDIEGTSSELIAKGYAWVLLKYEINITGHLPSLDEKFYIRTYHDPSHGYNTLRNFHVESADGKEIINAKTSWLLVEFKSGKLVKPSAHIPGIMIKDTAQIDPDFQEIPDFDDSECIKTVEQSVRFHDIDSNSHVNNAVYFSWIHDAAPVDFTKYELEFAACSFRSGAKLGETVKILIAEPEQNTFSYKIMRENLAKPSANFVCKWKLREED